MDPLLGVLWYVALLLSLTCHEAAHAWAALRGGDPTAYAAGQVTLDPTPHMRREPFGMILVPLYFFFAHGWMMGWASTPYDPRWAMEYPRRAAWMSLAGPAANLALVGLAALGMAVGVGAGVFALPEGLRFVGFDGVVVAAAGASPMVETAAIFVSVLFALNLLLCVFNLIPVPPLDGSAAIALLLPESMGRQLQLLWMRPGLSMLGIVAAWLLVGRVFGAVFPVAVDLLYAVLAG